jgi:HEPN domain-containing protein
MTYRMAHHALEYYLKAGLSVFRSIKDMKKLGHNIESLWREYEQHVSGVEVDARVIRV